jgi:hypothetical protein
MEEVVADFVAADFEVAVGFVVGAGFLAAGFAMGKVERRHGSLTRTWRRRRRLTSMSVFKSGLTTVYTT